MRLFAAWFEEATQSEPRDPTAMSLATVDADGCPNVRMVLMKGFDERGFVFYTNIDSQKGQELDASRQGALLFHWKSLNRQVRLRGPVERVEDAEADAYFATRPRLAQIGAWASKQSAPLESRHAFEKAIALYTAKFAVGTIPQTAELDRLPSAAAADRVLARPAVPAARPGRVQPRRGRRAVAKDAALSVARMERSEVRSSRISLRFIAREDIRAETASAREDGAYALMSSRADAVNALKLG